MITTIGSINIDLLLQKQFLKSRKNSPVLRTFRIYSLNNFPMYHTAVLAIVIMWYITSLILIYLKTGSLDL